MPVILPTTDLKKVIVLLTNIVRITRFPITYFARAYPVVPVPFVEKTILSSIKLLWYLS